MTKHKNKNFLPFHFSYNKPKTVYMRIFYCYIADAVNAGGPPLSPGRFRGWLALGRIPEPADTPAAAANILKEEKTP